MNITRRQFIKFSSFAGSALWMGLPGCTRVFDYVPPAEQDFIPIAGIFPAPDSIGEKGIHLRWALPPSKGIPDTITIYRREGSKKKNDILIRPAESNEKSLPIKIKQITFSGPVDTFHLSQTNYGKCYEVNSLNPNNSLKIIFSSGVDFCNIQIGVVNPSIATSYHQDGSVSQSIEIKNTEVYKTIHFEAQNGRPIKYVQIPINFRYLYFIEFNGNQYLCDEPGWEKIGSIDNEDDIDDQGLFGRISVDTRNYYLQNDSDRVKYESAAKHYAGLMKAIREPSDLYFENYDNGVPPEKLILKTINHSSTKVNAWNLLMLGSIDPNNARMLGLYFVDNSVKNENEIYDYKVEANYSGKSGEHTICGVVQSVGSKYSSLPNLQDSLNLIQLENTWWEFDSGYNKTHLGKVRLSWYEPNQNPNNELWKRFVDPVVYALQIDSNKPKLISPQIDKEPGSIYFLDQRAIIKKQDIKYALTGIDIFGQSSNHLKSGIKLIDKDTPPAPVKLEFQTLNNKIYLNYEYGGYQFLTDPQIQKFTIYHKSDSLYSQNKKIRYTLFDLGNNENGDKHLTIYLEENINPAIFRNIHFIADFTGRKIPAAKRRKFKINNSDTDSVTIVYPGTDDFSPEAMGTVLLEADTKDKSSGWQEIGSDNSIKQPVESHLINYTHYVEDSLDIEHFAQNNFGNNQVFNAIALSCSGKPLSDTISLFEPEPVVHNNITEICINRTILESDILTNGKIHIEDSALPTDNSFDILSQSSGDGNASLYHLQTKLIINTDIKINPGTKVRISLPKIKNEVQTENLNPIETNNNKLIYDWMIFRIEDVADLNLKIGGEFLLRGTKNFLKNDEGMIIRNYSETVHVIARIVSDFYLIGDNKLEVLIRISKKVSFLNTAANSNKILYFEPYSTEITGIVNSIALGKNESLKPLYFAIDTTDDAGNVSPFSFVTQFIKTRSKEEKPITPVQPYPCGNKEADLAYLKLPNSEGRSTFCLEWDDIKDVHNESMQYRYEVGRALDKTIVAVHKDLWLKGLVPSISTPITTVNGGKKIIPGNVLESGLITATAEYGISDNSLPKKFSIPQDFIGGRLKTDDDNKYYEIANCKKEANELKITLRQMVKTTLADNFTDYSPFPPQNGSSSNPNAVSPLIESTFTMEALHDYNDVLKDDIKLTNLANLQTNEFPNIPDGLGAFSLVTGQPLRKQNERDDTIIFIDDVPGLGSSRFFYKVRSVDASEIRSAWSPVSVPVWQVDTKPPEAPLITYIEGLEQAAYLKWRNDMDDRIIGYNLYRTDKKVGNKIVDDYSTETLVAILKKKNPELNELPISFSRIRHRYNQVELPLDDQFWSNSPANANNQITGVYKLDNSGQPDTTVNYFVAAPTKLTENIINNIHPTISNDVQLVLVLSSISNEEIIIFKNGDNNLITHDGQIIIPQGLNINIHNPIKGIFKIEEYTINADTNSQSAENYYVKDVTNNSKKYLLKYFYSGLEQNEVVAVEITLLDNTKQIIQFDTSQFEYIENLEDHLTLDLFYNYRTESIKQIMLNPLAKLLSKKSKDVLVQIKMNTPPPIPEVVSSEWWDIDRNIIADNSTANYGVRFVVKVIESRGYYQLKRYSSLKNIFEIRQENLNQFTVQQEGSLIIEIVDLQTEGKNIFIFQIEFIDYWGNNSFIVIQIN